MNQLIAKGFIGLNIIVGTVTLANEAKAAPAIQSGKNFSAESKTVGPTCVSSDPDHICLAVKYVVYKDDSGQGLLSSDDAVANISGINSVWDQCKIGFQMEQFQAVAPASVGLNYSPANDDELAGIRSDFVEDNSLLVVTTGTWNRSGSLGNTGANAWTNLPGDFPLGVVLEQPVDNFPNIIAHELGHYLGLLHVGDASDLMNPIIYPDSMTLTSDQCDSARSTAFSSWVKMLR